MTKKQIQPLVHMLYCVFFMLDPSVLGRFGFGPMFTIGEDRSDPTSHLSITKQPKPLNILTPS